MKLIDTPELVTWDRVHYIYTERTGPFQHVAPLAWMTVNKLAPVLAETHQVLGYMAMFKAKEQIYRAGVSVAGAPSVLPEGLSYLTFPGGKYNQFVVMGSYSDLPAAWSRVMQIVQEKQIELRDDFAIERYINDPKSNQGWRSAGGENPLEYAMTELLVPVP